MTPNFITSLEVNTRYAAAAVEPSMDPNVTETLGPTEERLKFEFGGGFYALPRGAGAGGEGQGGQLPPPPTFCLKGMDMPVPPLNFGNHVLHC